MITMKKYLLKILIAIAAIVVVGIEIQLYFKYKATENIIEVVKSLDEERDTTWSLRNYEVLTDSINNIIKEWRNDTSK